MDAFLDKVIAWIDANQTIIGLVIIVCQAYINKILIAIDRIHKIAQSHTGMTDAEKLKKAVDDICSLVGKSLTWVLLIPGFKQFLGFCVNWVFQRIKPKNP